MYFIGLLLNWFRASWISKLWLTSKWVICLLLSWDHKKKSQWTFDSQWTYVATSKNEMVKTVKWWQTTISNFSETLPVEHLGGQPLCMSQYYQVLSSCRIPGTKSDSVINYAQGRRPPSHITVVHNFQVSKHLPFTFGFLAQLFCFKCLRMDLCLKFIVLLLHSNYFCSTYWQIMHVVSALPVGSSLC